jgi:hypothetical protein
MVHNLGLHQWYREHADNAFWIKKSQALAFVPPDRVIDASEELVTSLDPETDELLGDFLVYFETTWIGIYRPKRTSTPISFDIDL